MTLDELRALRNATHFRPFSFLITTGERFEVPHPDFLVVPPDRPGIPREDYLIYYPPELPGFVWVSIDHVVMVRFDVFEPKGNQA